MLVLQPSKRITIEQMKHHRWMTVEVMETSNVNSNISCDTSTFEPNEQVVRIMQNLGIDSQRTRESLKVKEVKYFTDFTLIVNLQNNSYDHYTAFYLLLSERLRNKDKEVLNGICKQDTQKRRPSSIAEQAMRKLTIVSNQRYWKIYANECYLNINILPIGYIYFSDFRSEPPPISPRHVTSHLSSETLTSLHSPFHSIILRDSSIREQSTALSLEDNLSLNVGMDMNRYANIYNNAPPHIHQASIQMSLRDSTTSVFRDPSVSSSFTDSNRFLINGLDQRIIKQSSEDCRRLLQQVRLTNAK